MSPPRVAVVGARGYVGSALTEAFRAHGGYLVVPVVRADYERHREGEYDVLVNAACPSKRYWAEQHPDDDHARTVTLTARLRKEWHAGHFVHISSMSARTQPGTAYGRHRAEAEQLCTDEGSFVVRLGPMYGGDYRKGVLADMAADLPVYASGRSRQSFAPVRWCAEWIAAHADGTGLREIGARTHVTLAEVRDRAGSGSEFVKDVVDDQYPTTGTETDWPRAEAVVDWLARWRAGGARGR